MPLGTRLFQVVEGPGNAATAATAERDGLLAVLRRAGAVIMSNACGPCIGQWKREVPEKEADRPNSIVTSFNRNFAKRADGNPNTHAFIVSPQVAVALAFSGGFSLPEGVKAPCVDELPPRGFATGADGYQAPVPGSPDPEIDPASERIQRLQPFPSWDGSDFLELPLLIKTAGKCTTDHISMAGPWLRFRGHLQNISQNLLLGATDAFTGMSGVPVAQRAAELKKTEGGSVIVAGDNYGEGSSREHAAMEPRYLGVKAILAKSFARIHETNLKKQGVLALTFADPADYDKVRPGDRISVLCSAIEPGTPLQVVLHHSDGPAESIEARHSYNGQQIGWLRAGSALNALSASRK